MSDKLVAATENNMRLDLLITRVTNSRCNTRYQKATLYVLAPVLGHAIPQEIFVFAAMSARVSPELAPPRISPRVTSRRQSFFRSLLHRESFCAWTFIAPALVGFSVFYLLPTFRAIYISFTDWNLLRAPVFNAGANYIKLWNDPNFWNSMKITVLYVLYNIPIQTVIGLLLAVLLARVGRSVVLRSIILPPYLIANVIAAIVWFWMLDPLLGCGNAVLN